ncbi:unannotated protein [freshwater metagenome]|uniref:Unannotated protein n=1 Tax=freshwater metagenome TaxID=449393 RepID=A0A6J7IMM6_9ZZZZ
MSSLRRLPCPGLCRSAKSRSPPCGRGFPADASAPTRASSCSPTLARARPAPKPPERSSQWRRPARMCSWLPGIPLRSMDSRVLSIRRQWPRASSQVPSAITSLRPSSAVGHSSRGCRWLSPRRSPFLPSFQRLSTAHSCATHPPHPSPPCRPSRHRRLLRHCRPSASANRPEGCLPPSPGHPRSCSPGRRSRVR